jgi:ankyrin repeat protein
MFAASQGKEDVVRLLLERGANPKLIANNGQSAVLAAAKAGHRGVVALIIEAIKPPSKVVEQSNSARATAAAAKENFRN